MSSVDVRVEHHVRGDKAVYFESSYRPQAIRFDSADDLYICDQSTRIFKLKRAGGIELVLRIPKPDLAPLGVDCIAVNAAGDIYANNLYQGSAHHFRRTRDGFDAGSQIGVSVAGTKKGMVSTNSGDLFVIVMQSVGASCVLHVHPDGTETSFPVRGSAHIIGIGPDGRLYIPPYDTGSIDVYEQDGRQIDTIKLEVNGAVGDLAVSVDGTIYVAIHNTGQLLKLNQSSTGFQQSIIAKDLGNPTSVALDSRDRIYIGAFTAGRIYVIY
jgi:outer membrane protein assembly factor BamB